MDQIFTQPAKLGAAAPRVDGRLKVTGEARYASDTPLADRAYAFLATAGIARGQITNIDEGASRSVPGVLEILTAAISATRSSEPSCSAMAATPPARSSRCNRPKSQSLHLPVSTGLPQRAQIGFGTALNPALQSEQITSGPRPAHTRHLGG